MKYLYHGSAVEGIKTLRPSSTLHGTQRKVVYLTDSLPYALLYIWDPAHVGWPQKHVTAWVGEGLTQYEEQFQGQLAAFYQGSRGWLYRMEPTPEMGPVEGRDSLFFSPGGAAVAGAEFIPDVYEALMEQERLGKLRVLRFEERSPEERRELTERIAQVIAQNEFYRGQELAGFYRKYFGEAWALAEFRAG